MANMLFTNCLPFLAEITEKLKEIVAKPGNSILFG
jgi:hypothetical protein